MVRLAPTRGPLFPILFPLSRSQVEASGLDTIIVSQGVTGCPHKERVDVPEGEPCPERPCWARL